MSSGVIEINGNFQLSQIAQGGNGTWQDPYIIEDKVIDGLNGSHCISIMNTDKYFILENCTIYNASIGIYLGNVSNCLFSGNKINNLQLTGLYLNNSVNNTLVSNEISSSTIALEFFESSNNSIYNNNFHSNLFSGIYLEGSHFLYLTYLKCGYYLLVLTHQHQYLI